MPELDTRSVLPRRAEFYKNMIAIADKKLVETFGNENDQLYWYKEKQHFEGLLRDCKGA